MAETEGEYRPGQAWFGEALDAQALVAGHERFLWFSMAQAGMMVALEQGELERDESAKIVGIFEQDVADYKQATQAFVVTLENLVANAKRNAGLEP